MDFGIIMTNINAKELIFPFKRKVIFSKEHLEFSVVNDINYRHKILKGRRNLTKKICQCQIMRVNNPTME